VRRAAEHPADEDEPITAQWLSECGGRMDDPSFAFEQSRYATLFLYLHAKTPMCWLCSEGNDKVPLPFPATRGQFRRLAESLGIDIKGK
jgi:hypothetical protein